MDAKNAAHPPVEGKKKLRPSLTGALITAFGGPFFWAALFKVGFSFSFF